MRKLSDRFLKIVSELKCQHPEYLPNVYGFVYLALDAACQGLGLEAGQHVTGEQLLKDGVVKLARQQWGYFAIEVLNFWGVHSCRDLTIIVERLVAFNVFKKNGSESFKGFDQMPLEELFA